MFRNTLPMTLILLIAQHILAAEGESKPGPDTLTLPTFRPRF